jgi:hypothetical protein
MKKPSSRKKKAVIQRVPRTIDCPNHHLPIPLRRDGNKVYAIDTCPILGNRWRGQRVYERFIKETDND